MATSGDNKPHVCDKCGCEAELKTKEEKSVDTGKGTIKIGTLVCKVCGNEADIILEEI